MKESFPMSETPGAREYGKKEMNGIPYMVDGDGGYTFEDVNIGGYTPDGEDFRDFIVNRERVGTRSDATLGLPKGTVLEDGPAGEILFTLPRSKQRGKIYKDGRTIWAVPVNE